MKLRGTVAGSLAVASGGRQGVVIGLNDGRQATVRFSTIAVDGTLEILAAGGATQVSTTLSPGVIALPELTP